MSRMTFQPFKHLAGDIYQRIGTPDGFKWRHITRAMAWGHVLDLLSEANVANGMGDTVHAKRLGNDANCLVLAIRDHDDWRQCAAVPVPANDRHREHA